jgi:hypothetical protein
MINNKNYKDTEIILGQILMGLYLMLHMNISSHISTYKDQE